MEELHNIPPESKIKRLFLELHDFGVFTTPIVITLEDAQGYFDICEKYEELEAITLQDYSNEFAEEIISYLLQISKNNNLLVGRKQEGWVSNINLDLILNYQLYLN